ncbi:MAG TPA: hypothetical protein VLB73_00655 [Patescibacteria group bacterium]|nr:hypothetical protein [Patescibacteria group bacterium]
MRIFGRQEQEGPPAGGTGDAGYPNVAQYPDDTPRIPKVIKRDDPLRRAHPNRPVNHSEVGDPGTPSAPKPQSR